MKGKLEEIRLSKTQKEGRGRKRKQTERVETVEAGGYLGQRESMPVSKTTEPF